MIEIGELCIEVFGPAEEGEARRYAQEVARVLGELLRAEEALEVEVDLLEARVGPQPWPSAHQLASQLRDEVCRQTEAL